VYYDIMLDNNQFLPHVVSADGENAAFMVVGGHDGIIEFKIMPDLHRRKVVAYHRLRKIHWVPILGKILRRRWAKRHRARIEKPRWFPDAPFASWNI
jgi:hypothetical protein